MVSYCLQVYHGELLFTGLLWWATVYRFTMVSYCLQVYHGELLFTGLPW